MTTWHDHICYICATTLYNFISGVESVGYLSFWKFDLFFFPFAIFSFSSYKFTILDKLSFEIQYNEVGYLNLWLWFRHEFLLLLKDVTNSDVCNIHAYS